MIEPSAPTLSVRPLRNGVEGSATTGNRPLCAGQQANLPLLANGGWATGNRPESVRPTPVHIVTDERIIETSVATTTELKAKATMTFVRTSLQPARVIALPGRAAVIVEESTENVR